MFYEATDKIPTVSELQKTYEDRLKGTIPKRPDPEPKKERKPRNPDFFATFEKFVKEGGEKNAWTRSILNGNSSEPIPVAVPSS